MTRESDDFRRWGADWQRDAGGIDLDQILGRLTARRRQARAERWIHGAGFAALVALGALSLIWFGHNNPASPFVLLFAGLAFGWSLASSRATEARVDAAPADHARELLLRERELSTRYRRGRWLFWLALAFVLSWVPWTLRSHAAVFADEPWPLLRAALVLLVTLALFWYRAWRISQHAAQRLAALERVLDDVHAG